MSTSGGGAGPYSSVPAGKTVLFGQASSTFAGWAAGQLLLAPYYLPNPLKLTQLGVSVTAAGDVGSTMTPCAYRDDGTGSVGAFIGATAALDTGSVGSKLGAFNFTLPAGFVWLGALPLAFAVTAPTLNALSPLYARFPTADAHQYVGSLSATFPFQSGLAAPPNPFAGGIGGGIAALMLGVT